MGFLEYLRLAALLLENDLFKANSNCKDPVTVVHFDVSPSPIRNKATSSESIENQMSLSSGDQMVKSGVTIVNSEIVVQSSDPIDIGAVAE